jgi:hypothetical protein
VIPRVLAKESLNLELRLQRYGEKKFRDLFVTSREWLRVFFEIFLKIRGASCNYVGCGLILEKMRGLSAKYQETRFSRNYFVEEKLVDQVHESVDDPCLGPPWTIHGRRPELVGAWPTAALVLKGTSQGAEDGETGSGNPLRASPEDGRW